MDRPLKIVFFTASTSPQGTFFRSHNFAVCLQRLGHEVVVYAVDGRGVRDREQVYDGVLYKVIPAAKGQRFFGHISHPGNLLRGVLAVPPKADIYHVFQPFPITCLPSVLWSKRAGKLVYDWDDYWQAGMIQTGVFEKPGLPDLAAHSIWQLEDRMPAWADAVTTCSHYLAEEARIRGAHSADVIHNGYWEGAPLTSKKETRQQLGLASDAYYYGFMGRTCAELDWCIDVFRTASPARKNMRLALCGMVESALPQMDEETRRKIDYLGCLPPDKADAFAKAIDCGLIPLEDTAFNQSRFPIKFVGHMAAGTDVICSKVGEISHLAQGNPRILLAGATRTEWRNALENHQSGTSTTITPTSVASKDLLWPAIVSKLEAAYFRMLGAR